MVLRLSIWGKNYAKEQDKRRNKMSIPEILMCVFMALLIMSVLDKKRNS